MDNFEVLEGSFRGVFPRSPVRRARETAQHPELFVLEAQAFRLARVGARSNPVFLSGYDDYESVRQDGFFGSWLNQAVQSLSASVKVSNSVAIAAAS